MHITYDIRVGMFLISFLILAVSSSRPANAQKIPIAIQSNVAASPTNAADYQALASDYKSTPTVAKRNKLVFLAVSQIDINFRHYQRKRRIGKDLFHLVMDILEIGASTAISITNGARAKSIIGEGLTFLQGSRASADKNLRLLELQIIFNKMIEKRSAILVDILQKSTLSNEQYPFDRAYIDIVAYFNAGTWDSALSNLATDTGAAAQAAQALLEAKKAAGIKFAPTPAEIAAAAVNLARMSAIRGTYATLQKTIDDEKVKASPVAATIKSAEDAQKDILNKLAVLFGIMESDPNLGPLLDEIPSKYGATTPATKLALEQSLEKLRDVSKKPSIDDYDRILTKLGGLVTDKINEDLSLNTRLKNILDTYK
jgi:hypothetical protein